MESFREAAGIVRIVTDRRVTALRDLMTGRELVGQPRGDAMVFEAMAGPGRYSVFGAVRQKQE